MFTCTTSSLKGISEANKKNPSIMRGGRCTWINLPELLDSAELTQSTYYPISMRKNKQANKRNNNPGSKY